MKRSLRQDAEHRGPEVDPVLYRFSSGVCWRLPIPSAINKKTVIPPPQNPPTPIVGTPSQASVAVGRESGHLHTHTPPSRVCWESPSAARLRWKAQLLAFQH